MSTWPSQPGGLLSWRRGFGARSGFGRPTISTVEPRRLVWLGCLTVLLAAQGVAVAHSYLWALPAVCVLFIAVAGDLPLLPLLAVTLLVRVLVDDSSSVTSRHSGSLNSSGVIALMLILLAVGLLLRRRKAVWFAVLATLWLCLWTAIAVNTHGASTETIREGVRELSVVAVAVIVYNSRGVLSVSVVTRLIQVAGIYSAILAIYQFATHTGLLVAGQVRSNGTFAHPDSAAMFFAIATLASLWQYFDNGRHRYDMLFTIAYALAAITTFSLGGLISLLAMLMAFGTLRPGSVYLKLGSYMVAGLIMVAFLATPLGAERIANETSTEITSARKHSETSLAWRFYKWGTLIPEWERAPLLGQGLGTTTTSEGTEANLAAGNLPHNEYVRYLVETGAIGLVTLLWGAFILIRRLARRRRAPGTHNVGTLGLAIAIGCLIDALADNTFLNSTTGYAAALIIAAVLVSPSIATAAANRRSRMRQRTV
jgi:uncharacterized protein (TIGR03382 family)